MGLVSVSKPFDAKNKVELKFDLSPCHGLSDGGELRLRFDADSPEASYEVGREFSIRIHEL